jgi:hypothetical protein
MRDGDISTVRNMGEPIPIYNHLTCAHGKPLNFECVACQLVFGPNRVVF